MKTLNEVINKLECYPVSPSTLPCSVSIVTVEDLTDALHYLKTLKAKNEEPPLGEPPDYIPLDFHRLAEMIGEPVYVKDSGCKGRWEIVMGVRKTADGEDVCFRGCNQWQRIGKTIYRTKEGAG